MDRASAVTGVDTRKNTHWVDVNALDRARAANIPGTKEHEEAEKNKEGINAWQRECLYLAQVLLLSLISEQVSGSISKMMAHMTANMTSTMANATERR